MESIFFSIDPPPKKKEYVLYTQLNIDNYEWPLIICYIQCNFLMTD